LEEEPAEASQEHLRSMKDKFLAEEIDEMFGTEQDKTIVDTDIPERLQLQLAGRFDPSEEEVSIEADWIFNSFLETFKFNQ
jgi:hypothetical protein